jgi:hypothetical protein
MAQVNPASFASALGGWLLDGEDRIPLESVQDLILGCQDKLIGWLLNRLKKEDDRPPLERVTALVMICNTAHVVPLVERLLEVLDKRESLPVLLRLTEIDDFRSVQVLRGRYRKLDESARERVLRGLGKMRCPQAEEFLREVAAQSRWQGGRTEDQLIALSALGQCGTRRSAEVLTRLKCRWWYLFTGGGRKIRYMAGSALKAIEVRERKSTLAERRSP